MPRKNNISIPRKPPVKQEMMEQAPVGMAMKSEPATKPPKREKNKNKIKKF